MLVTLAGSLLILTFAVRLAKGFGFDFPLLFIEQKYHLFS